MWAIDSSYGERPTALGTDTLMATLFTPATCSRCSSHDGAWHAARFEWTFGKNEPVLYCRSSRMVLDGN